MSKYQVAAVAFGGILLASSFALSTRGSAETAVVVPPFAMAQTADAKAESEKAVLAGGCFWGVQGVYQHLKGVRNAVSGYAGGPADKAQYEIVSTGTTGHAESVEITFDPRVVSYATILQVYFSVAHNPTELNRQGPDSGTQYRSAIFPQSDAQKEAAEAYIQQLGKTGIFDAPIVTTIETAKTFYPAEPYHQDYATLHPDNPYIAYNDLPKIDNLSRLFPDLYQPKPTLVAASGSN
ncbi:peptide-methionine (S)-S-oxide reductase MsrA [soil metagenome]